MGRFSEGYDDSNFGYLWTIVWELGYANDGIGDDAQRRWWNVYRLVCSWLGRKPNMRLQP